MIFTRKEKISCNTLANVMMKVYKRDLETYKSRKQYFDELLNENLSSKGSSRKTSDHNLYNSICAIDPYKSFEDNLHIPKENGIVDMDDFIVLVYDKLIEEESLIILSSIDSYIEKFTIDFTEKNNLVVQDYFMEERYYDPVYKDKLISLKENVVLFEELKTFISQMIDIYEFSFRKILMPGPTDFVQIERYSKSWNNFLANYQMIYSNWYSLYVSSTGFTEIKRRMGAYFYNFHSHCDNLIDNLGEEYKNVLGKYAEQYYSVINPFLRDKENYIKGLKKALSPEKVDVKDIKKNIKLLDEVFVTLPVLNQSITVYRGIKDGNGDEEFILDKMSKTYVSTSVDIGQARSFTGVKCCFFYITIPAGFKIIPMSKYSVYHEEEILLPRNTKFQVVNTEEPFEWDGRIVAPKKFYLTCLN